MASPVVRTMKADIEEDRRHQKLCGLYVSALEEFSSQFGVLDCARVDGLSTAAVGPKVCWKRRRYSVHSLGEGVRRHLGGLHGQGGFGG